MNIDWKQASKSQGYRSLKAVYVKSVQEEHHRIRRGFRRFRDKMEHRRYFKQDIALTMQHAHRLNIDFIDTLNTLEEKMDYSWLNFYQNHQVKRILFESVCCASRQ